jgi:hypothetical protein
MTQETSSHVVTHLHGGYRQIISKHDAIFGDCFSLAPEFCGFQEARQLFGLSRSHLYRLADEGRIKSVVLRGRGKLRGRRLFVVESIRSLLLSNLCESK